MPSRLPHPRYRDAAAAGPRDRRASGGPAQWVRAGAVALVLSVAGLLGTHAVAQVGEPRQDEIAWTPELAPRGPLVIVVSLPAQRIHVYRNGVRIGTAPVSTGKPGYETPSGNYPILERRREHYSNLYDNAPMPFMQRLTWDGVAMHAGRVPGYPASHGCVRLPRTFAEQLYAVTQRGTRVVIAGAETFPATVTWPGLLAPVDAGTGLAVRPPEPREAPWEWHPERSPHGPVTMVLSTTDRRMVVLRNAVEIGRAGVELLDESIRGVRGVRAYVLLEGSLPTPSLAVPDRPALRWRTLQLPGSVASTAHLPGTMETGGLPLPAEFSRAVHDTLRPGDTVILTDEPLLAADVPVVSKHDANQVGNGEEATAPAPSALASCR